MQVGDVKHFMQVVQGGQVLSVTYLYQLSSLAVSCESASLKSPPAVTKDTLVSLRHANVGTGVGS